MSVDTSADANVNYGKHDLAEAFAALPTIPRARYIDEGLYALEIERIFKRTWLAVAHDSELPEPGSYRSIDLPFAPVLIVRDGQGHLRAFLNSCTHRGAPVVRGGQGCARVLTCQYHSWSFSLDGKLVGVPSRADFCGLDVGGLSLTPLRCELWGREIFINLDRNAPPLLEYLDSIVDRYSMVVEAPLRFVSRSSYTVDCNWKVGVEAFYESYHLPTIHKNTAARSYDVKQTKLLLHANGHGTMLTRYRDEALANRPRRAQLPGIPGVDFGAWSPFVGLFPNALFTVQSFGFSTMTIWPLAIDRCCIDLVWYGCDWGDGPMPEAWKDRVSYLDTVMHEDIENLSPIQRSIEAEPERGVPLCTQESRLWHFNANVDKCIGADAIDPALHVPDLLADFVEP